ncbi:MAG: 2-dehydropantoate 2-reductase [Flavobacteriaceae bacterium]|nr:2-dehydropantoate 2-reductase [Flavobacteriaceae bacterium]
MIRRVAVIGIGGVGGYFGGRLCNSDTHITFVARGEHANTIAQYGLEVQSILGDFRAQPDTIVAQIGEIEAPDLILLGVKSWQLGEVAKALVPVLQEHTVVIPLQNGANNVAQLLLHIPATNIIGGVSRIISKIERPGVVRHFAYDPHLIVGELDNGTSARLTAIGELFASAGIDHELSNQIEVDIWIKYLFITTISGIGALTRMEMGTIRSSAYLYQMMRNTALEILAVARAKGIDLQEEVIDKVFAAIDKQHPNTTASMQRDMMEGKPSELESFNGYIVAEGRRLGVEVAVNEFIYHCLLPMEQQVRNAF